MELPTNIKVKYVERRSTDLKECLEALRAEEYEIIEQTGHQIKGSAETFGHRDLGLIGHNLEKAAQSRNYEQAEFLLMKFKDWVKNKLN